MKSNGESYLKSLLVSVSTRHRYIHFTYVQYNIYVAVMQRIDLVIRPDAGLKPLKVRSNLGTASGAFFIKLI